MSHGEFLMVVFGFFAIGGAAMAIVLVRMLENNNPDAAIAGATMVLGLILFVMVGTGITVHLFGLKKPYVRGIYSEIVHTTTAAA